MYQRSAPPGTTWRPGRDRWVWPGDLPPALRGDEPPESPAAEAVRMAWEPLLPGQEVPLIGERTS